MRNTTLLAREVGGVTPPTSLSHIFVVFRMYLSCIYHVSIMFHLTPYTLHLQSFDDKGIIIISCKSNATSKIDDTKYTPNQLMPELRGRKQGRTILFFHTLAL